MITMIKGLTGLTRIKGLTGLTRIKPDRFWGFLLPIFCFLLLTFYFLLFTGVAVAQSPSIHPTFAMLDENGQNVLESGGAVSTMKTCGVCHDTAYIESHSFHANAGLSQLTKPGQTAAGWVWDISPGLFGKWNPLTYRYVTPQGDATMDLGTADWIRILGARHVGGGPAVRRRDGQPLTQTLKVSETFRISSQDNDPEANSFENGTVKRWNWQASGVVEMNCFLCHTTRPNNQARLAELNKGNFRWVNTAVLSGTGLVTESGEGWQWNPKAFNEKGQVTTGFVKAPADENCGLCHGIVHNTPAPLITNGCQSPTQPSPDASYLWNTLTSGQIFSPQRLKESGLNLADKESLSRVWDIHAQRLVNCVDCHYSINNPIYYQEASNKQPGHLMFDSRRRDINEYLYRPSHEFAKSAETNRRMENWANEDAQTGNLATSQSMRRCESCHSVEVTHDWLPYKERHLNAVSCEGCHIPKLYAPAAQQVDWTVLSLTSEPVLACRGLEGERGTATARMTGYEPVLLPRQEADGRARLTPYNLLTSWFWVYGDPVRPVRLADLQAAYLDGNAYRPEIINLLDSNGDGKLSEAELKLDTTAKVETIKSRLESLGLENPHIQGQVQPYGIHHNVTNGAWVTQTCETCHQEKSRLTRPMALATYRPAGVMPELARDTNAQLNGQLYLDEQGQVMYRPSSQAAGLYVLGHDSNFWANWLGILAVVGTLLGVLGHGGLRIWVARRLRPHESEVKMVYMHSTYKRLWHWLQAAAIIALIVTGLVIHLPDVFSMVNFWLAVQVHNIVAFILVANAFLAAFYHFASGEIRQYLPEPDDFFSRAIAQTMYYLQGIFQGAPHPFEKTPEKKLNPLQQMVYLIILNVLLPLQVITGILMWGAQRWPDLAAQLGGLTLLAAFHSLIAWLFISVLIAHMYLTTTGDTPFSLIKGMIVGWEEIEK